MKQKINCSVHNCKYNNELEHLCQLKQINITCTCNQEQCINKKETICNSFEEK